MVPRILRFPDLKDAGIVNNRATLYRWIKDHGFPPGVLLGPNSRGWAEADVLGWLDSRLVEEDTHRARRLNVEAEAIGRGATFGGAPVRLHLPTL